MSEKHLSIALVEMGVEKKIIDKIKAEVNENLLKTNRYSQGKKEYLDKSTLQRMLNEAFNYRWSWEVLNYQVVKDDNGDYALVLGRLYLPGLGYRDAFGAAKLDKKDNSAAFAAASAYAFKNAIKQTGFAANLFDDNYDEELWEEDFDDDEEEEEEEEPPKKKPTKEQKSEFTKEQKEAIAELKEIYKIENNKQLLAFFQIWDPDIKNIKEITPEMLDEFLEFYEENEEEFEDFDPDEVE